MQALQCFFEYRVQLIFCVLCIFCDHGYSIVHSLEHILEGGLVLFHVGISLLRVLDCLLKCLTNGDQWVVAVLSLRVTSVDLAVYAQHGLTLRAEELVILVLVGVAFTELSRSFLD